MHCERKESVCLEQTESLYHEREERIYCEQNENVRWAEEPMSCERTSRCSVSDRVDVL